MSSQEIPPIPTGVDKRTRDWMDAVSAKLKRLYKGRQRAVTLAELIGAGIASESAAGTVSAPSSNATVPPQVTGLSASGALDNIMVTWTPPDYSNFAHYEIWRSSSNDIGTATKIGTTSSAIYTDSIGAGATRYYWVRIVSRSGVYGPFSASVQGKTGRDPAYVMDVLTHTRWAASTAYVTFNYVRPTTPNGKQYLCTVAGTSSGSEPTWPTTPGQTVVDGTVTWRCEAATAMVPFVIGTIDGNPAVAMHGAFIEDATIRSAKVYDLSADKITTGTLAVGQKIQVGGAVWAGDDDWRDDSTGGVAGFWLGLVSSSPRFQLTTSGNVPADPTAEYVPGDYRRVSFDGTNFSFINVDIYGKDGKFDDLYVYSLSAEFIGAGVCSADEYLVPSAAAPAIDDPTYPNFLGYTEPYRRTEYDSNHAITGVGSGTFGTYGPNVAETAAIADIIPFDESSTNRKRSNCDEIGFRILFTRPEGDAECILTILEEDDTELLVIDISGSYSTPPTAQASSSQDFAASGGGGDITVSFSFSDDYGLAVCETDGGLLNFHNGDRLKCKFELFQHKEYADVGTNATIEVYFQLVTIVKNLTESNEDEILLV